jgi:hypothetical protein
LLLAIGVVYAATELASFSLRGLHARAPQHPWPLQRQSLGAIRFCRCVQSLDGWYDQDVLGIDLGITMVMAENHRTGFVWEAFMKNPEARSAMQKKGIPLNVTGLLLFAARRAVSLEMSLFNARAFDDSNVAVERDVREGFDSAARLRPADLQLVDFSAIADTEDFARVVRGKVTSATDL